MSYLQKRQVSGNRLYYDSIAGQYDQLLGRELHNETLRNEVADVFRRSVPAGTVLDFGGGTGNDLGWLTAHGYQVIFCEPSAGMRGMAMAKYTGSNVHFLFGGSTDITRWQEALPAPLPADAVLANFAVINNIGCLSTLFAALAAATRPGGHAFLLCLHTGFRARWKAGARAVLTGWITGSPLTTITRYNGYEQTVYLHTPPSIIKSAAAHFRYEGSPIHSDAGFVLLHFTRR